MARLALVCILALYVVAGWATMEPVTGVREEYASLTAVWRRGNVQAPMLVAGDRSGVLSQGGPKATAWLSAVEVADTIQDMTAGEKESRKDSEPVETGRLAVSNPVAENTETDMSRPSLLPSPSTYRQNIDNSQSDRSGRATWVHPSLHGNTQADGRVYSRWNERYAASNDYPLGTVLELRHGERAITVEVQDRGALPEGQFDLSEAGFVRLAGDLDVGIVAVEIAGP